MKLPVSEITEFAPARVEFIADRIPARGQSEGGASRAQPTVGCKYAHDVGLSRFHWDPIAAAGYR